mgnify:CR=1 FL=1
MIGTGLALDLPVNQFPLHEDDRPAVLIAGGIGITPIWSMAQRLQKLGRSFQLHYACRDRNEGVFLQELTSGCRQWQRAGTGLS